MTTDSYTTNGTYQWTCPSGVTTVTTLEILGANASGAGPSTNTGQAGGGGGGGSYGSWSSITVVPGTQYSLTVGAGGHTQHGAAGIAGAQSSMTIGAATYFAAGGAQGLSGTPSTGGAGGAGGAAPSNNSPAAAHAGGNGAAGTASTGPAGGGGGAATSGGAGANASAGTGGTGGGNGGTSGSPNGVSGTAGAGGGGFNAGSGSTSGAGTDGYVKITYTLAAGGLTFRQAGTIASGTGSVTATLSSNTLSNSLLVAGLASQGGTFNGPAGWADITAAKMGGSGTQIAVNVGARVPAQTLGYPSKTPGNTLADFLWAQGYLGNINCTKLFYTTLPASFSGQQGSDLPAGVTPVICYMTPQTNVASYVSSVTRPIVLVYHQEPEGDYTLGSTFVSEFKKESNTIRAQSNSNVQVAMCAAGSPYGAGGTADVLAGNYLRGLGPYVDLFLKDVYQDQAKAGGWSAQGLAGLPRWTNWLNLVTNPAIVGTVQPLGVAEYGIGQTAGDAARLAHIQMDAAYLSGPFLSVTTFPLQYWMYWWVDNGMQTATDLPNENQFLDGATQNQWAAYAAATAAGGRSALWWYPGCASGLNSFTFTGTAGQECRASVMEFTSDASTTQVVEAKGGAASGPAGSLTVSTSPASAMGDLAVATFMNGYPAGVPGTTWGLPSGMTKAASSQADVVNLWNGYQAQLGSGTESETQTFSDTTMTGWAGIEATFKQVTGSSLAVQTSSLPGGLVGNTYAATITASGGQLPYTWSISVGSLPAWATLNTAAGTITGTPTAAATTSFTAEVTDNLGATATAALSIVVSAGLSITTGSNLPAATVGSAYSTTVSASGGTTPYSWAVVTGALPQGLTLGAADGTITGTPVQPVNGSFTIAVTDATGTTVSEPMFLVVTTTAGSAGTGAPNVYVNWPDLRTQLGLVLTTPVQPAGTFLLDDPVYGVLDTDRLGSSEVWTDISVYTRSGDINRPSSRLQGPLYAYQAGTASVQVKNDSGNFDPDNLSGPFVAGGVTQLNAMIPFRQYAVWGGRQYPLFSGFTDGITDDGVNYANRYAEVAIPATDGFKILAGINLAALTAAKGDGETSGQRITRLLDLAGWYTGNGWRDVDTGDSAVQGTTLGDYALNLMQVTADSEAGELYINGAGKVVFRHRQAIITETQSMVVQAIFGDSPGTAHTLPDGSTVLNELPMTTPARSRDDTTLANDIQAQSQGGSLQEVEDTASIQKYRFPRTYQRTDLILTDDPTTLNWANWVLYISKTDEDRFDQLTISPLRDPVNLWPQALGREIGDRIRIYRRPPGVGSPVVMDCFIRGISHTWSASPLSWQTTWTLQSASRYGSFFVISDPVLGVLDSNALAF